MLTSPTKVSHNAPFLIISFLTSSSLPALLEQLIISAVSGAARQKERFPMRDQHTISKINLTHAVLHRLNRLPHIDTRHRHQRHIRKLQPAVFPLHNKSSFLWMIFAHISTYCVRIIWYLNIIMQMWAYTIFIILYQKNTLDKLDI